jgi:hypothetical protein
LRIAPIADCGLIEGLQSAIANPQSAIEIIRNLQSAIRN